MHIAARKKGYQGGDVVTVAVAEGLAEGNVLHTTSLHDTGIILKPVGYMEVDWMGVVGGRLHSRVGVPRECQRTWCGCENWILARDPSDINDS